MHRIARLPHVQRVESYGLMNAAVLAPNGAVEFNAVGIPGSIDGEYFSQDRPSIVQGRMANPARADEVVVDARGTPASVHVGQVIPFGFFTSAQESSPDFGRPGVKPLSADQRQGGRQGRVQPGGGGGPDRHRAATAACCSPRPSPGGWCSAAPWAARAPSSLSGGSRDVAATEASIERLLPKGFPVEFYVTSLTTAKAERAIRPESIALGVFGGIAALAALLIAGQLIGRQLRLGAGDLGILRALGADPAMTVGDGLPGILGAVVAGSLLAAVVAVVLSPLAPLGSVRAVYPQPGIATDWAVLGVGAAVLIGVLFAGGRGAGLPGSAAPGRPAEPGRAGPRIGGRACGRSAGPAAARGRRASGWPSTPAAGAARCRSGRPSWARPWP